MFSFARYLPGCAFLLTLMLFNRPAHAEWDWSFPFYTPDSGAACQGRSDTSASAACNVAPSPAQSAVQAPEAGSTAVQLPSAPPPTDLKPAEPVPTQPPREFSAFSPVLKLGSLTLDEDTRWSGSLQIDGTVTVSPQATLTVAPGSVIRFSAHSGILVFGRIALQGTPENPVVVSSLYETPVPGDWNGIYLIGTEKNNVFDHTVIQGADTALQASFSAFAANGLRIDSAATALKLSNATATVRNSALSGSPAGIRAVKSEIDLEAVTFERNGTAVTLQSSALTAVNVRIRNSTQTAFIAEKSQLKLDRMLFSANLNGLKTTECEGSVANSRFLANSETAAILTASHLKFSDNHISGSRVGLQLDDSFPALWRNSISGNSSYNLLYLGEGRYFVGGNWLGRKSPESSVFSKQPGALLTAPLLAVDPHPPVGLDSAKVTD